MGVERREIVVIGAGPAGSAAALEAARAGFCPMLIEKENSPGVRNACGGLAAYAFRYTLELPPEVIEHEVSRTILRIDGDRFEFAAARPIYISFRRDVFDAFLAQRAVRAGAELLSSARATSVDSASRRIVLKNLANGSEREVEAEVIIFADGPMTLAVESYGIGHRPGPSTRRAIFLELEGSYGDDKTIEYVVNTSLRTSACFWIFPKRDRVRVGAGEPLRSGPMSLEARLTQFIEARPDLRGRKVLEKGAGIIPGERAERLTADGAMVVGDAGGLVNPLTGGGIAFALLSGEIAGRVAAAAVKRGETNRRALLSYPRHLRTTPHYFWLALMDRCRRSFDHKSPASQAAAYAQMLKHYFGFFHAMRPFVNLAFRPRRFIG